jgi:hypothetical protein
MLKLSSFVTDGSLASELSLLINVSLFSLFAPKFDVEPQKGNLLLSVSKLESLFTRSCYDALTIAFSEILLFESGLINPSLPFTSFISICKLCSEFL